MTFRTVGDIALATEEGRTHSQIYFKTTYPFGGAGQWSDGASTTGTPVYQAYVGTAKASNALENYGNQGIYTGPQLALPKPKYLLNYNLLAGGSGAPASAILCDYLMFYPFIDCDDTTTQDLNADAELPRYKSGEGVSCFIVTQVPNTALSSCTMNLEYFDTDETLQTVDVRVLGNTTIGVMMNTSEVGKAGAVGNRSPFVDLGNAVKGIRSIKRVTLDVPIGGFACLVLAKPLHMFPIWEQSTYNEKVFLRQTGTLPKIENGAHLNLLYNLAGGAGGLQPMTGNFTFVWS
jgi:hypothetical protein